MEIDPKKMDFDKMKSGKNLKSDANVNQAGNVDGVDNGVKYNPAPSFTPPANPSPISNPSQPTTSLKKPTELLSEAWGLYKARWKTFLGIIVAPILLMLLAFLVFRIGAFGMGFLDISFSEFSAVNILVYSIGFVLILALFLAIIIIQIWSQVALIYAIKDNEDIGIKKAYQKSKSKIKSFFWASILVGFITMGGFILFTVPGFIFAVWFAFAVFIVITENLKGMDAVLKSREYARGYWWQILWRFLFLYIVMIGVMIVASIVLMLIPILGNLVSIALTPLIMIYMFLIYGNLREIKGNFEFMPSAKAKKSFIAVGVLGIVAIPLLFGLIIITSLNSAKDKVMDANNKYEESINSAEESFEDTIKNRDKQRVLDLYSISKMLKRHKEENGIYPVSYTSTKLNENNQVTRKIKSANENADIPVDPNDPSYYYSYKSVNGKSFEIAARLENMEDKDCEIVNNMCIYKISN
ncbi:MAG: hypothetical protein U9N04_00200 [Patescibacteria group bacterium]|nr:hypothetical protein [Patescibacteria group bacterium]